MPSIIIEELCSKGHQWGKCDGIAESVGDGRSMRVIRQISETTTGNTDYDYLNAQFVKTVLDEMRPVESVGMVGWE